MDPLSKTQEQKSTLKAPLFTCLKAAALFDVFLMSRFLLPARPDVFVFATRAKEKTNAVLTCLATGFDTKDVILNIKRNSRILTADDGVKSSRVRPNDDNTFQRRDYVEFLRTDSASYSCEVVHQASNMRVVKAWGKTRFVASYVHRL